MNLLNNKWGQMKLITLRIKGDRAFNKNKKEDGGIYRQLLLRCSTTYVHVGKY